MARPTGLEPATHCLEELLEGFFAVGFEPVDDTGRHWMTVEKASKRHQCDAPTETGTSLPASQNHCRLNSPKCWGQNNQKTEHHDNHDDDLS